MSWSKVDDQWYAHPKVVGISLAARGLWTTVLSWTCAQRRPTVPEHMVRFLAGGQFADEFADELVHAGLWHKPGHGCQDCPDVADGWVVHHWSDYQEKSLSEKRAEAGRRGGKASGEARRKQPDEANTKQTEGASEAEGEAGTRPVPSRPVQETLGAPQADATKTPPRKRATQLPDRWAPNDGHHELARAERVNLDREAAKFRDHHAAKGSTFKDWDRAFSNWLRKAAEYGAQRQPAGRDDTGPVIV